MTNESEKKENEAIKDLDDLVLGAFSDAGMDFKAWVKGVVKLTKAKKYKDQKLTGEVKDDSLKRGVKRVADSDKEGLVSVPHPDNDIRLSAYTLIGKATGWVDPDSLEAKFKEPVIIEIHEEGDSVGVNPEA